MALKEQQLHRTFLLENQLKEYAAQDLYPMHMPGHKRQAPEERLRDPGHLTNEDTGTGEAGGACTSLSGLPYSWDVTEVPGTDDLHDADGILRDAMDRTAALYGAAQTWYLVNGSTVGLLAGIRAIAPYGSEIIVARNCHKAVYHAIELQNLTVHWVWPSRNTAYDIYESVDPRDVAAMLEHYPDSVAVVLTSPTYEGVVSDIRAIAESCHAHCTKAHPYGIPLLVDEAHGAHLGFHEAFPRSALDCGADVVVQSAHKTLPSLTQTAWMHIPFHSLAEASAIERELDVFETSSPSYPLLASMDGCTGILRDYGEAMFASYAARLEQILRPAILRLQHLQVFGYDTGDSGCSNHSSREMTDSQNGMNPARVYARDPSKILISGRGCEIDGEPCTGAYLADLLREEYGIETEMHLGWNVLAMTSICDTEAGMRRLADALIDIDRRAVHTECPAYYETLQGFYGDNDGTSGPYEVDSAAAQAGMDEDCRHAEHVLFHVLSETVCTISEATRAPARTVRASRAAGCVAAEYVYCYPPGIPVVVPGERITEDILEQIRVWELQGADVHHSGMQSGYRVIAKCIECRPLSYTQR